ncbi:MAG TPA: hypothetical protein DCL21_03305 [Alphaproteobacteria bacterium]|nr:hypothetical protein [Alphaproteobacteria bacterium]
MKKIIISLMTILVATSAMAEVNEKEGYGTRYFPGMEYFPKVRPVEHKKEIAPDFKPANLLQDASQIADIRFKLITKEDPEGKNLEWSLDLPFRYVFLTRFATMSRADDYTPEKDIWGRSYEKLEITFIRADGKVLPPYYLYKNTIKVNNAKYVDTSKEIEDWAFSTVRNYKELAFVNRALNIDNYKRCVDIGNLAHETSPEQCIFPDGTTFLNINTEMKNDTIRTFNFDSCFANKNPLIAGFPRRCVAPGGHVYTEQPKVR